MDKLVLAVSLAGVTADTWSGSGHGSADGTGGFSGSGSGSGSGMMYGGSYGPDGMMQDGPKPLPKPFKPPRCDRHDAGKEDDIQVTMKVLSDLSKKLEDDIK